VDTTLGESSYYLPYLGICKTQNVLVQGWAISGPNVARHSVFSGPRKHSGTIIKSEIFSNLSQ